MRSDTLVMGENVSPVVAGLLTALGLCSSALVGAHWRAAASALELPRPAAYAVAPAPASAVVPSRPPAVVPPAPVSVARPVPVERPIVEPEKAPEKRARCYVTLGYLKDSDTPLATDAAEIDRLGVWLRVRPTVRILVRAHADGAGTPQHNFELSERRAAWVKARFEADGLSAGRITAQAFGEYVPIEGVETQVDPEDDRNRRTEIVLRGVSRSDCPGRLEEETP